MKQTLYLYVCGICGSCHHDRQIVNAHAPIFVTLDDLTDRNTDDLDNLSEVGCSGTGLAYPAVLAIITIDIGDSA